MPPSETSQVVHLSFCPHRSTDNAGFYLTTCWTLLLNATKRKTANFMSKIVFCTFNLQTTFIWCFGPCLSYLSQRPWCWSEWECCTWFQKIRKLNQCKESIQNKIRKFFHICALHQWRLHLGLIQMSALTAHRTIFWQYMSIENTKLVKALYTRSRWCPETTATFEHNLQAKNCVDKLFLVLDLKIRQKQPKT